MTTVPSAQDVATQLGGQATAESVGLAYLAEVADQAARCRVDPYSDALAAALVRRVARAMQMKNHALGVVIDGELGSTYIGSTDPEVRRLEAPHRRVVVA